MSESLFEVRSLTIVEKPDGIQISVGKAHDFRSEDLGPEDIARLNHELNRWITRFTSRA